MTGRIGRALQPQFREAVLNATRSILKWKGRP